MCPTLDSYRANSSQDASLLHLATHLLSFLLPPLSAAVLSPWPGEEAGQGVATAKVPGRRGKPGRRGGYADQYSSYVIG